MPSAGELPAWVLERPSRTSPTGEERGEWIADTIATPAAVLPGTQEDTLTKLTFYHAGQIARGRMDYDIALFNLYLWTSHLPLGNESDPWTKEHVRDRLDRALEKRKKESPITFVGGPAEIGAGSTGGKKRELTTIARSQLAAFRIRPGRLSAICPARLTSPRPFQNG